MLYVMCSGWPGKKTNTLNADGMKCLQHDSHYNPLDKGSHWSRIRSDAESFD